MTYFTNVKTLEALKNEYRSLTKKHHPDLQGGSDEAMKKINLEYEVLFEKLKDVKSTENVNDFMSIIDKLVKFENIDIEIVGTWVWVGGSTFSIKEELKTLGFKFSGGRKKWYLGDTTKKKKASKITFDEMRQVYGSEKVKTNSQKQIS